MFFESVKIKKTDWHYKLMIWVYGESLIPKMNFCPYFWMAILAIIFIELIVVFKGILYLKKLLLRAYNAVFGFFERMLWGGILKDEEYLFYSWVFYTGNEQKMFRGEPYIKWEKRQAYSKAYMNLRRVMEKRGKVNKLDEKIVQICKKREERKAELESYWAERERIKNENAVIIEERKRKLEELKRKQIAAKQIFYMKWGKKLGMAIAVMFLVALFWGIWNYVIPVLTGIKWSEFIYGFWEVLIVVGHVLLIASICFLTFCFVFLVYSILKFVWMKVFMGVYKRWIDNYGKDPWPIRILNKLLNILKIATAQVCNYMNYIWLGIKEFFRFFWTMFMAWKNNNCPGIEWETEEDK